MYLGSVARGRHKVLIKQTNLKLAQNYNHPTDALSLAKKSYVKFELVKVIYVLRTGVGGKVVKVRNRKCCFGVR